MVIIVVGTNSYVTRLVANTYLDGSARAAAWTDVSGSDRDRALVSAFRAIEDARYQGTRTGGDSQVAQFPRDGIKNCDGIDRSGDSPAPIEVQEAQMEYAFEISQDTALEAKSGSGSNVKGVGAGSAKVTFFQPGRDASGKKGTPFPYIVQKKLRCFLASAALGIESFGTDGKSTFDDCEKFGLSEGLK